MTVEEGHVLNIDGTNANKYKSTERNMSAVSRGSAFHVTSDVEEGSNTMGPPGTSDRVSVLSGMDIVNNLDTLVEKGIDVVEGVLGGLTPL